MFTYDPTTDAGKIRLVIGDRWGGESLIFEDEEIEVFLLVEGSNWRRGAALALETMATQEVYIQKVIKLLSLSTNGAAVSAELLKRAALLRKQADDGDADPEMDQSGIEIAEQIYPPFGLREYVIRQWQRGAW